MNQVLVGDCRHLLKAIKSNSIQCCITSPPYWGLRDYGVPDQLGLEKTPEEYTAKMVEIFREVRRVIRDDGTLWLNLGDSYAANWNSRRPEGGGGLKKDNGRERITKPPPGLKSKDLVGIPWRVAFALQADGWYLRSDIIWHKPNPMPESVTDRPTKAHEYIFLMTKSQKYFYDAEAIKEPSIWGDPRKPYYPGQVDQRGNGHDRGGGKIRPSVKRGTFSGKTEAMASEGRNAFRAVEDYRNKRSVWTISTQPFPGAHFATFPPDLIRPCILAGSRRGDLVIDPFSGSGTTGAVCAEYGRRYLGMELNPDYAEMRAEERSKLTFL